MGRVLEAALRLTAAVPTQVDVFTRAPLQALAHLHALTATGFVPASDLGRPRAGDDADDPLNLGPVVPAGVAADRLARLASTLTTPTQAPALIVAAIAHAELAVLRPFAWGSGLLARATPRLVLAGRGVDPSLFSIPEHGMLELGRPAYVRALRAYASGTPAGVSEFLVWHATAMAMGARAASVP
jgi:Fic family protein